MNLEIEKRDYSELSYKEFVDKYLIPEKPVIIRNAKTFNTDILTHDYLKENFMDEDQREAGWFTSELVDSETIRIPEFILATLNRDDISVRKSPMRLFLHPAGNFTLPHYDASSMHGFNQQIIGKKHWVITSPNTPLPCIPFIFAGSVGKDFKYNRNIHDYYEFDTLPGDILFLPRYWFHEVHAIDPINLNLNWVFTPITPNESSILGRREVELVKLKKTLSIFNKIFGSKKYSNYGGRGEDLINVYSENVGIFRMLTRLAKEISGYPRLLFNLKTIKIRANKLSKNNFNV